MQARLARDGLTRIADIQKLDEKTLAKRYGSMGLRLAHLARGEDARSVTPERKAKSISAETTFDDDRATAEELLPVLRKLCGARVRAPQEAKRLPAGWSCSS